MHKFLFSLITISLLMIGCGKSPQTPAAENPVEAIKALIARGEENAKGTNLSYTERITLPDSIIPNGWFKCKYFITDLSYDVEKTDSLVSPYTAIITFKVYNKQSAVFATKTLAESASLDAYQSDPEKYELHYAFQDEKWVLKSARSHIDSLDKWYDEMSPLYNPDGSEKLRPRSLFQQ